MSPEQNRAYQQLYAYNPAARQWRIDHAGHISRSTFTVLLGLFFGFSVVTIILRLFIRIYTRHKLYIDDYVVLFGLTCLIPAGYLNFANAQLIFLHYAIRQWPKVVPTISEEIQLLNSLKILDSALALVWTATFSVKLSFLLFFRQLIDRVSKGITMYYWMVFIFTVVSWIFVVCEPFILCPHFDSEAIKCMPAPWKKVILTLDMNALVTILDAVSDLLIISIPILILRKTKIKLRQKLSMGIFLCLSFAMIVVAMARMSKYHVKTLEMAWQLFWLGMEACIALIMASLTIFRTVFVTMRNERKEKEKKHLFVSSIRQRLRHRLNRRNPRDELETNELPTIPRGILTGMRTFISRNNRSLDEGTRAEDSHLKEGHDLEESAMNSNLSKDDHE